MTQWNPQDVRRWRNPEGEDNQERYFDTYRYTPYSTDFEFFSNPSIYETDDILRANDYNDWPMGPYRGRGPRGYRRSDDRIQEEVNDLLTWDGQIDASDILVEVQDGVVTLSGAVPDRDQKRRAGRMVENVIGVMDVNNELQITRLPGGERSRMGQTIGNQIRVGMKVLGSDDQEVGKVKEVRSQDFLVDRPMARDVYVPFDACDISDEQIRLHIGAYDVDEQNWPVPELFGTAETKNRSE